MELYNIFDLPQEDGGAARPYCLSNNGTVTGAIQAR